MDADEIYCCPGCKKAVRTGAVHFPFCSDRCRLLDLGAWFDGDYRVSRSVAPSYLDEDMLSEFEDGSG